MTAAHPAPEGEVVPDLEKAADEAIAICGGNARAAVLALLTANGFLEHELELTRMAVSFGYSRGWHRNRAGKASPVEVEGRAVKRSH